MGALVQGVGCWEQIQLSLLLPSLVIIITQLHLEHTHAHNTSHTTPSNALNTQGG